MNYRFYVRASLVVVMCFGFVLINAKQALADTLIVPDDFATIQAAIDAAQNGDIVQVNPGTYDPGATLGIDFGGKAITVQSAFGPEVTIVDCGGFGRAFRFNQGEGNDTVLSGFTVTNCGGSIASGAIGISANPTIERMIIRDNQLSGVFVFQTPAAPLGVRPVIRDTIISGNDAPPSEAGGIDTFRNLLVENTTIVDNEGAGAQVGGTANATLELVNVTVSSNDDGGVIAQPGNSVSVVNSVVYENPGPEVIAFGTATATVTYSNIQGGFTGVGNIDADPRFEDTVAGNYRLLGDSPCIDVASTTAAPLADQDGLLRFDHPLPNGNAGFADMGAYERALLRGDTIRDFRLGVEDAIRIANVLSGLTSTSPLTQLEFDVVADVNGNGVVTNTGQTGAENDVFYLMEYLFAGGPAPIPLP